MKSLQPANLNYTDQETGFKRSKNKSEFKWHESNNVFIYLKKYEYLNQTNNNCVRKFNAYS